MKRLIAAAAAVLVLVVLAETGFIFPTCETVERDGIMWKLLGCDSYGGGSGAGN